MEKLADTNLERSFSTVFIEQSCFSYFNFITSLNLIYSVICVCLCLHVHIHGCEYVSLSMPPLGTVRHVVQCVCGGQRVREQLEAGSLFPPCESQARKSGQLAWESALHSELAVSSLRDFKSST